jgi:hypothetical protein
MKKGNNLPSWQSGAAIGSLSTALIAYIQSGKYGFSPDDVQLYTTLTPIICTFLVTLVSWALAHLGVKSPNEIRVEKVLSGRISNLAEEIQKAEDLGVNTTKLKAKYAEAVLAKDKLSEQSVVAIVTGA